LLTPLTSSIGKSRDSLKGSNNTIMAALKKVMDACTPPEDGGKPDADDVEAACEGFKKTARGISPPTNEEDTPQDDKAADTPATNPLSLPGVPTSINSQ
jgi:hypothetical protein